MLFTLVITLINTKCYSVFVCMTSSSLDKYSSRKWHFHKHYVIFGYIETGFIYFKHVHYSLRVQKYLSVILQIINEQILLSIAECHGVYNMHILLGVWMNRFKSILLIQTLPPPMKAMLFLYNNAARIKHLFR